jgi:site-specific DNA recombinase
MATPRKALVYVRISQDREGAGLGVDRQREDCEALARQRGWTVVGMHVDNDISASNGKPRPGYKALLADLEAGRADTVICWHTDRLHRRPAELEEYISICERRKVTTQTVQAGELDLSNPSGRMVARMLGSAARYEVEHKSERTRRAQSQAAKAGKWLGGQKPLGWILREDGSATLDVPAARRIRKATADVLGGASLGSITARWNQSGFTTSTGRPWSYATVRQVLVRARNAGLIEFRGEVVADSKWPALVTPDELFALRRMFADPTRRRSQSTRARWLMAGIAVCGAEGCGAVLRSATCGTRTGSGRTVYRCLAPGKGHVARTAMAVDELIRRIVAVRLSRPDVADLLDGGDSTHLGAAELRTQATALRLRLTEAADSFADDKISQSQLETITAKLNARRVAVEREQNSVNRSAVLAGLAGAPDPAKAFRDAPIDRQRAIIRELMTVTIMPGLRGRAFAPELIRIDWR